VCVEVFFFALVAIIFGFAIALLFPPFTDTEPWYYSLIYMFFELLADAIIIFALSTAYFMLFGVHANSFIGITVFANVFFMIQETLKQRLENIFTLYTQVEIKHNVPIVHPKKRPPPLPSLPPPIPSLKEYEYIVK
jgi:hypothetical protein